MSVSEEAYQYATNRVEDWKAVHTGNEKAADSLLLVLSSLGFDEDQKEAFFEWLEVVAPNADHGSALIGLLVGLFINQYNLDNGY